MPTIAILSAMRSRGKTSAGCEVCTLPLEHAVHAHGSEGAEVSVRAEAPMPRVTELCDAYGMLQQAERDLAGYRNETALQTLRDAIALLRSELGAHVAPSAARLQAYRERVAAQGRAIDAHLNERGRKQRKRR